MVNSSDSESDFGNMGSCRVLKLSGARQAILRGTEPISGLTRAFILQHSLYFSSRNTPVAISH